MTSKESCEGMPREEGSSERIMRGENSKGRQREGWKIFRSGGNCKRYVRKGETVWITR